MPNLCDGVGTHFQKQIKNVKAYEDGVQYRMGGTALGRPITGNPEDGVGSEYEACWDAGWNDAHAGTIEGCSAYTGETAPA